MIETAVKNLDGLTLLIAPPAWGKTQLLKKLFEEKQNYFVFISPLRALANEFYENIKDQFQVLNIERMTDWKNLKKDDQIIIVTPELLTEHRLHFLSQRTMILDEFHLYFYWGTSFREEMWRGLIDICTISKKIVALTATMSESNFSFMREQFKNFEQEITIIDVGNQRLKNKPQKIVYLNSKEPTTWKYFVNLEQESTILLFCQFRNQVRKLEKYYQEQGVNVLSCLGGEASHFSQKLKLNPRPQLIISTTVLSHGVNLPRLDKIVFTYKVANEDFWIQMVGRGGRKGECFEVITYDQFMLNKWLKFRSFFTIMLVKAKYHLTW